MTSYLDDIDILLSLGVAAALYVIGLVLIKLNNQRGGGAFLTKLFTAAFLLRVGAVFGVYFFLISAGGDGYVIDDDRSYNRTALEIAAALEERRPAFKQYGSGFVNIAYFNLNGFLYHYLNFDTLTMRILNSFFGAIAVLLVFKIMLQLFDSRTAKIAAILVAFIPNMIFWSASQVKDPLIILCTMSIIYLLVCRFRRGFSLLSAIAYLFFMFLLWHLRKDFCFPLIAVSLVWIVFRYTAISRYFDNARRATAMKIVILCVLSLPLLLGLGMTGAGEKFLGTIIQFNEFQKALSVPESSGTRVGFSRYLRVVSAGDFYKLPPAMAFTAISPLPVFTTNANPASYGTLIYSTANIFLVFMMPFIALGLFKFKSPNMQFTDELLVRWLPLITLASISIIYMGIPRYKASIVPYFLMWAALGWRYRKKNHSLLIMLYGIAVVGVLGAVLLATMLR